MCSQQRGKIHYMVLTVSQPARVSPAQCFRLREQVLRRLGGELEGDSAHKDDWKLEGQGVRQPCLEHAQSDRLPKADGFASRSLEWGSW